MEVKRGDIAIVVISGEIGKPRPAVIVQADEIGQATSTVLVCPISSDLTMNLPVRPIIEPGETTGLRVRSQIMTDKMLALRRDRLKQVIGAIDADTHENLDRAMLLMLGLSR